MMIIIEEFKTNLTEDGKSTNTLQSYVGDITDNTVQVYIDTIKAIDYKGTLDTTYRGIGFSGATGGYNQKNFIDDFEIAIKR